jgi:serralysin
MDLFHYAAPGVRTFVGTQAGYFSPDSGNTNLDNFNTSTAGDFGDWAASAGNDSFLAFGNSGGIAAITTADLRVMDVIGWDRSGGSSPGTLIGDNSDNTLVGSNGDDTIFGLGGNDAILGNGGNDALIGGPGNDAIDGGPGDDTAIFAGNLSSYAVKDFNQFILISGPDGNDRLTTIEHLRFDDGIVNVADGSALFDTLFYDRGYSDVYHAGLNALAHFNASGWHEGRDPNPYFSTSFYLAANPDVRASGANPLTQYDQTGWREGRDPSPNFDTKL